MIAARDEVLRCPIGEHGGRLAVDIADDTPGIRYDFSVSLNAFGPAPIVRREIDESPIDEYPDPASRIARRAAADCWRRPMTEIMLGAGAAELIHAACIAFVRPGDRVLIVGPAFGEYARAAALCGATITSSCIGSDGGDEAGDVDALTRIVSQLRARLVFAAAPMNPTGYALGLSALQHLADACRAADSLLVLDQAFDAFTAYPLGTPSLAGHSHVLHLRSLTKDHALAGIRVAFAIGPAHIIDAIERARVPWATSTAAQAAATAALTDDALAHVARTTTMLRDEAARIAAALAVHGVESDPTATHYFLIHCADASLLRRHLLTTAGILVRDCTSFDMPERIRVAARTPVENDALIAALTDTSATT
ncbi:MAG TPA: histidinol-phosphate transaminase [Gemmatimonadaceae bacterium]|jgi:histidinol-phosphate/aromatic aminotransferase/cobyric acid decarboxylase-like protein